jgi:flavoprotein
LKDIDNKFIEEMLTEIDCKRCNGTGTMTENIKTGATFEDKEVTCSKCSGYGKEINEEAREFMKFLYDQMNISDKIKNTPPRTYG